MLSIADRLAVGRWIIPTQFAALSPAGSPSRHFLDELTRRDETIRHAGEGRPLPESDDVSIEVLWPSGTEQVISSGLRAREVRTVEEK